MRATRLALVIVALAAAAGAATLGQYVAALTRIDAALRANCLDEARACSQWRRISAALRPVAARSA